MVLVAFLCWKIEKCSRTQQCFGEYGCTPYEVGIISLGSDIIDQLLNIYSVLDRYWRKMGQNINCLRT